MKTLVLVTVYVCIVYGEMEIASTQSGIRAPLASKSLSVFPTASKPDLYFQQMQLQPQYQQPQAQYQQPQQQYIPVQVVPAQVYQNHQPQAAMIIIAQPAAIPQQAIYSPATQQLLHYFNSNPQAKYQLLSGYHQQQPVQQYLAQPTVGQPTLAYQSQPQTQIHQQAVPIQTQPVQQYVLPAAHQTYNQNAQYQLPNTGSSFGPIASTQLSHISTLAQLTAQKYLPQLRSVAPIITGLENFTPEQQAQIKAQLNSGGPFTPLQSNAIAATPIQQNVNAQAIPKIQSQPAQSTGPQEFSPSEEDKASSQAQTANNSYNSAIGFRNQFTKG